LHTLAWGAIVITIIVMSSFTPLVHFIFYLVYGWFPLWQCFEAHEMSQLCLSEGCSTTELVMNARLEAVFNFSLRATSTLRIAILHQFLCVRAHSSFGPCLSLALFHVQAFPLHVLDHLRFGGNLLHVFEDGRSSQLHSALLFK
jgi:hypothetical protein